MTQNKFDPTAIRKACLLGAEPLTKNMGVGALFMGSMRCIYHTYPDIEISLLNYHDEAININCNINGRDHSARLINIRFSKKLYLPNNIIVLIIWSVVTALFPFPIRKWLRRQNRWLREIITNDLFFSIAGGDSLSDIYGLGQFFYVMLPQLLCLLLEKPIVQLPQTIGPFKRRWVAALSGYILRKSVVVYSRDRDGVPLAKMLIGKRMHSGQVRFSPDMAFVMEPHEPGCIPPLVFDHQTGILIGFNVSGLLWNHGCNRNNRFGLNCSYTEFMHKLIDMFITKDNIKVVLIPHGFADSVDSDLTICKHLYQELSPSFGDRIILISQPLNQNEVKYVIGKCHFFIGARMHACIAALSQAVPAIGIAYSKKFKGVFETQMREVWL